jgi:hypothetical protein
MAAGPCRTRPVLHRVGALAPFYAAPTTRPWSAIVLHVPDRLLRSSAARADVTARAVPFAIGSLTGAVLLISYWSLNHEAIVSPSDGLAAMSEELTEVVKGELSPHRLLWMER